MTARKKLIEAGAAVVEGWEAISLATGYSCGTLRVYSATKKFDEMGIPVIRLDSGRIQMTRANVVKLAKRYEDNLTSRSSK